MAERTGVTSFPAEAGDVPSLLEFMELQESIGTMEKTVGTAARLLAELKAAMFYVAHPTEASVSLCRVST